MTAMQHANRASGTDAAIYPSVQQTTKSPDIAARSAVDIGIQTGQQQAVLHTPTIQTHTTGQPIVPMTTTQGTGKYKRPSRDWPRPTMLQHANTPVSTRPARQCKLPAHYIQ